MRDIAVVVIMFGLIPFILRYPWIGVLAYAWVSIFSPHRFGWGFAYDLPFAMVLGAVTIFSMLFQWKMVRFPTNSITVLLILLPTWMTVTTMFALEPGEALARWEAVMKVFLFTLITASLLHSRKQLEALLWVIVLSVGFYGVKGGIFTILMGGEYKVYGPPGDSFLSDNNAIAVGCIMTIPLTYYLATTVSSKPIRLGLYGTMLLSGMAVLGTQSRGALVGVLTMLAFLWLNTKGKLMSGMVLVVVGVLSIGFMPQGWVSRMESIGKYEQDSSAQGRLNTWYMAFNLANDRPLVGGGFELYTPSTFARYAPNPADLHSAHSIYFQMLGEHGYVGLALFLALGIASWRTAVRLKKASRSRPDYAWAGNLARAIQVSLIGFGTAGAFVNISYWEVVYYEIVILMASYRLVQSTEGKPGQGALEPKPNAAVG